ncbi:IS66 family insertion sequence element accessory protein TnpB [Exilibacterium tricleocarpae]|uniref:IS66 family insertion sequence element accessory protein TnpB n=2 Tax=Exilibacterium tricleocarpae TaxID=2591008 RepID=A0A545SKU2_9GAMM|nr:IS66 family insertion sequence element accessory protein TnpB [Exilibacterium tricleocarpae]
MTPTTEPKKYRTAEQWQTLVDQFKDSGLSTKKFCANHGIGYANFCNWRRRLSTPDTDQPKSLGSTPQFIDLGSLDRPGQRRWDIILKLGNGVELCLSQSCVSA